MVLWNCERSGLFRWPPRSIRNARASTVSGVGCITWVGRGSLFDCAVRPDGLAGGRAATSWAFCSSGQQKIKVRHFLLVLRRNATPRQKATTLWGRNSHSSQCQLFPEFPTQKCRSSLFYPALKLHYSFQGVSLSQVLSDRGGFQVT